MSASNGPPDTQHTPVTLNTPAGRRHDAPEPDHGPDAQRRAERAAQVMFTRDQASQRLGITLERIAPGFARLRMPVSDTMINGHGICHGGYLFTFADSAFAFACNSFNRVSVGASAQIEFVAPARLGEVLLAEARVRNQGRRSGIYDVVIENAEGRQIVLFRGRSHRLDETVFDESLPDRDLPDERTVRDPTADSTADRSGPPAEELTS